MATHHPSDGDFADSSTGERFNAYPVPRNRISPTEAKGGYTSSTWEKEETFDESLHSATFKTRE